MSDLKLRHAGGMIKMCGKQTRQVTNFIAMKCQPYNNRCPIYNQ